MARGSKKARSSRRGGGKRVRRPRRGAGTIWEHPALKGALLALVLLLVVLSNTGPIANNDYGLHLRIGQEIATSRRPPRYDFHSHTLPAAYYPAHEWLTQLGFYGLHELAGDGGMVLLRGLLIGGALALMAASLRGSPTLSLVLVALVMGLGFDHAHMRPHLLSWVMAAALNLLLQRRWNWAVLALLLLWGNTHGSVLLGVGMAGLNFLEHYWRERDYRALLWAGASALIPLLNPYGPSIYTLFFQISGHTGFIGEWQPYRPDTGPFWLLVGIFALSLWGLLKTSPFRWFDAARMAVLAVLAFQSSRNGVVAAIFLAPLWGRWFGEEVQRWSPWARRAAMGLVVVVMAVTLGRRVQGGRALRFELDHELLPVEAVDFVRAHDLHGPVFNDYNFGGYFLWKAWPELPVFIDGRTEVYKGPVLEAYLQVSNAEAGWEEIVGRYGITFFVVRPERDISRVLLERADWDLVYFDYNAVIYVRAGLFPALRRLEVVSPYGHRDRTRVEAATGEIRYLLGENPRFFGGYKILAFLLYRQGDYVGARQALLRYLDLHPEGIQVAETRALIDDLQAQGAWP